MRLATTARFFATTAPVVAGGRCKARMSLQDVWVEAMQRLYHGRRPEKESGLVSLYGELRLHLRDVRTVFGRSHGGRQSAASDDSVRRRGDPQKRQNA